MRPLEQAYKEKQKLKSGVFNVFIDYPNILEIQKKR